MGPLHWDPTPGLGGSECKPGGGSLGLKGKTSEIEPGLMPPVDIPSEEPTGEGLPPKTKEPPTSRASSSAATPKRRKERSERRSRSRRRKSKTRHKKRRETSSPKSEVGKEKKARPERPPEPPGPVASSELFLSSLTFWRLRLSLAGRHKSSRGSTDWRVTRRWNCTGRCSTTWGMGASHAPLGGHRWWPRSWIWWERQLRDPTTTQLVPELTFNSLVPLRANSRKSSL